MITGYQNGVLLVADAEEHMILLCSLTNFGGKLACPKNEVVGLFSLTHSARVVLLDDGKFQIVASILITHLSMQAD